MNFNQITDSLFIGTQPDPTDYDLLRDLGVRLVINMRAERKPHPDPKTPPLPVLWLPTYDAPFFPIPIRKLLEGVAAAIQTIQEGGKVYTHCAEGRHRGVAMGAAILIALGYSPEEAMRLIKQQRQVADPHRWYIRWRIQAFGKAWENNIK